MPAQFRILSNHKNKLTEAAISASEVLPVSAVVKEDTSYSGRGLVKIDGLYTGDSDLPVDVRVMTADGETSATEPVFSGVGTGSMSEVKLTGVAPQNFEVVLESLGIRTRAASAEFYGFSLEAKANLSALQGNSILLRTENTNIQKTFLDIATPEELSEGDEEVSSPSWDYGQRGLNSDGEIYSEAKRICFGTDPQVYRMYTESTVSGRTYKFIPSIVRAVPSGTKIYEVSGYYTLRVTADDMPTEVFTGVTLYEFLTKLKNSSAIVSVGGIITEDNTPNGINTIDFPLNTTAFHLPIIATGSEYATELEAVSIGSSPRNETLTMTCLENAIVGSERWKVVGTVSGEKTFITGESVLTNSLNFTVPKKLSPLVVNGDVFISSKSFPRDEADAIIPNVCLGPYKIGSAGFNGTITATLKKRGDTNACRCEDAVVSGAISLEALGYDPEDVEAVMADPEYLSRLKALYEWKNMMITSNISKEHISLYSDPSTDAVQESINVLYALNPPIRYIYKVTYWTPDFEYVGGVYRIERGHFVTKYWYPYYWYVDKDDPSNNQFAWRSSTTVPAFANNIGFPSMEIAESHESEIDEIQGKLSWYHPVLGATGPIYYNRDVMTIGSYQMIDTLTGDTTVQNDNLPTRYTYYGGSEEDLAFFNQVFGILKADLKNLCMFEPSRLAWDDLFAIAKVDLADLAESANTDEYNVSITNIYSGSLTTTYVKKYESLIELAYLAAGLEPGKVDPSEGSTEDNPWEDTGDTMYWDIPGYAPMFTNVVYHSTKFDENGDPYCTKEFAVTIKTACGEYLKEGDRVTIDFSSSSSQQKTYQVNDTFKVDVVKPNPLELYGGVDGDDTLTWSVNSDVSNNFPDYRLELADMREYSERGLLFQIAPGGIPFALGDKFTFSAEGGTFHYKRGDDPWSEEKKIETTSIGNGLSIAFEKGKAPSFLPGDQHLFTVLQPYTPENVLTSDDKVWEWQSSDVSITFDNLTGADISAFAIARHSIPKTALIYIEASNDGFDTTVYSNLVSWNEHVLVHILPNAVSASSWRIRITNAPESSIGWIWAGEMITTERAPDTFSLRKTFISEKGSNWNASSSYVGSGKAGEIGWSKFLFQKDFDALMEMIVYSKQENDAPFIIVPNYRKPSECALVSIQSDELDYTDEYNWTSAEEEDRLLSMNIPLNPVIL